MGGVVVGSDGADGDPVPACGMDVVGGLLAVSSVDVREVGSGGFSAGVGPIPLMDEA